MSWNPTVTKLCKYQWDLIHNPKCWVDGSCGSGETEAMWGNQLLAETPYFPIDKDKLKKVIADGIISTADFGYYLYLHLDTLSNKYPGSIDYLNRFIVIPMAKIAQSVTDMNPHTMDWLDLTVIWLFELGNYKKDDGVPTIFFYDNDKTTMDLKQEKAIKEARDKAIAKIKTGDLSPTTHWFVYGQDEFWEGISEQNLVTSFLGSYKILVTVEQKDDNNYVLTYTIENISGWESATRLRRDNDRDGQHDSIIPDKKRGEGIRLGGNFKQKWQWKENISLQ